MSHTAQSFDKLFATARRIWAKHNLIDNLITILIISKYSASDLFIKQGEINHS